MRQLSQLGILAAALAGVCSLNSVAQSQADSAVIARGKYLAEEVGKCQECHAPKLENGALDRERWMKGAVLDFAPLNTVPKWHKTSPDITGAGSLWKRWGDQAMIKFLETGLGPKGNKADPPMPAYTLSHEDAEAIVAYLKTLK